MTDDERVGGPPRVRVPLEQRVQYLEAVGDLGQEHGFEVLYMSQVAAEQVGPGGTTKCLYSPDEFEPVADVCGLFAQLGTQAGAYFHDPVHADARGHRMIGEYVLQRLDELGWTK